jgi:hypothetical protein
MVASRRSEPAKSDPVKSDPAMTRTSADAHAELGGLPSRDDKEVSAAQVSAPQISQQTLVASDYPKGPGQDQPDAVSDATPQSPVAARWPEPAGVRSASAEPPPPPFVVAAIAPDVKPGPAKTELVPAGAPAALAIAQAPATATPTSLEPLFLAAIGAITLTGFAGSSVYLLARIRRQPQSHASLARGAARPPAELVDPTRLPRWLEPAATDSTRYPYRVDATEAWSSDRRRGWHDV